MRWTWCLFLFACAKPPVQAAPAQSSEDIPPHTQALMDAYKNMEAERAMRRAAPAPTCPGDTPAERRERYLRSVGGCVEAPDPIDVGLDVGPRAQWPALYAALDAKQGVDRCFNHASAYLGVTGALQLRVELASDGEIKAVHAPGENGPDVACCARRALQGVKLPAPGRPLAVQLSSDDPTPAAPPGQLIGLRKEDIKAVISSHESELPSCFEPAIRAGLNHGGRVTVKFVIAPDGEVARADVESDELGATGAACCLVSKVRSWKFPKPKGEGIVIVSYPFALQR
ncbi:MAG: AgmX/PglI C-terminal domain-containing protein [Polyangiales bacterium]